MSLSHCFGLHLYATNGAPSETWGCLQPRRKVVTYVQEPPSLANQGTVTTMPQFPLLNQIWDPPHCWEGTEACSQPRDARNVTVPWGWHRYTRWNARLSHQTSNLSCPCNLLPEGCDPCFTQYQFQGGSR